MRRRIDVLALIVGLLMTGVAAGSLWLTVVGTINWQLLKVAAPLSLVIVGLLGLTLSRNRE
ncbi:hypothetical protein GCM10009841_10890 [Microlunatus panaciterrae]|uniref:Major facilitator superfamily (MFS) profile domain-containing protein n=1 Tax=Microlunatus panaciterrae TaxID=400768 RepID=A0ABS2RM33_9ACTN|nr:hypothetical protein [Microlunatus panaciterrae]MBM7799647.1 hypothetical protein [Microlunatus panaciterrae]